MSAPGSVTVAALSLRGVSKTFGAVQALRDVGFECRAGEIHALVGENGSGKSTLLGVASGVLASDAGTIEIGGRTLARASPAAARRLGLGIAYQDYSHVLDLSVAENLYLAVPAGARPPYGEMAAWAERMLTPFGLRIPVAAAAGSLSLGWQNCEKPALNQGINVVANEPTNWDPSKVQGIVAGILASHPQLKGFSYEDALFMSQGGYAAYQAAGLPYNAVLTLRTDEVAMGCLADKLKNPNLKIFYYTAGNSRIRVALTADMMKLAGAKIPPTIVFPIQMQTQSKRDMCIKGYPDAASPTSLIPVSLLHRMYP
jgi:ABC-type lipoprotein export system ATPase subunit